MKATKGQADGKAVNALLDARRAAAPDPRRSPYPGNPSRSGGDVTMHPVHGFLRVRTVALWTEPRAGGTSMNRMGAKAAAVLIAALLVGATACGGGSSKEESSGTGDAVTATTSAKTSSGTQ